MNRLVTVEVEDSVATVRLDRPPLNAFDELLRTQLGDAIRSVADDASIGAVVITGGQKAFSAGTDLEAGLALDRSFLAGMFATQDRMRGIASFLENGPGHARFGSSVDSA